MFVDDLLHHCGQITDYLDVIKDPIDLTMIEKRLNQPNTFYKTKVANMPYYCGRQCKIRCCLIVLGSLRRRFSALTSNGWSTTAVLSTVRIRHVIYLIHLFTLRCFIYFAATCSAGVLKSYLRRARHVFRCGMTAQTPWNSSSPAGWRRYRACSSDSRAMEGWLARCCQVRCGLAWIARLHYFA